jgi:hypothetical protein
LSFENAGSFGLADRLVLATVPVAAIQQGGIGMKSKLLNGLIAGALGTALALASPAASPAFAQRGGGGGGMHGGAMGGGGMGGGMRGGGIGGGMHAGGMAGRMHNLGGGARFSAMGGGAHFSGGRFAGAPLAHGAFSPRFSRFAFRDGFHHRRFHHRFNRFAFVGVPFVYAAYDSCWRRVWTARGLRWINVCGDIY